MHINVKRNFFFNVIYGFFNKFLVIILQFVLRTVVIKVLGEQYIGLNGLFSSILQFLSLAELGFGTALVQSMYEPIAQNDDNTISNILGMYKKFLSIIGFGILFIGMAMIPLIPFLIKDANYPSELNIFLIYFLYLLNTSISYGVLAYRGLLFSAHQKNAEISKVNVVVNVILYSLQIAVVVFCKNYYFLVLLYPVATFLQNLCITRKAKKMFPQYFVGKGQVKYCSEIIKKTKALIGQRIYGAIIHSADTITISAFMGLTVTAIYGNYYYIIQGIFSFLDIILLSLLAGIGNNLIVKTREENYKNFADITFLYNWVITVCASCLLSLFQPFMKIWMGEDLLFKEDVMILIVIYFYLWKMKDTIALYKDAKGLWWEDRYRPYICAMVDIILNILLIQKWGVKGVFAATIISDVGISFPWSVRVLYKEYFKDQEINYYKDTLIYVLKAVGISFITYLISGCVLCTTYIDLIVLAILCFVVSNILLLLVNIRSVRFKNIVHRLKIELQRTQ